MLKLAKKSRSSAPGPYLGYSQQQVRLFHHLLTCPDGGCHVSLEYLDDVAIHYANGELLLEQDKSGTATNPLTDLSKDLWRTIAIWIGLVVSKTVALDKCRFHLYVTPIQSGPWATLLSNATTAADLEPLLKKAKQLLKRKAQPACAADLKTFIDAEPDMRLELVKRLTVISSDDNPLEPVRMLLRATMDVALADETCSMGLGMAISRIEELLRAGKPPLIDADAFKKSFRAAARKSNMRGYLPDFAGIPAKSIVSAKLLTRPVFIRQLELIDADQDERLRAVADFLQASANKVNWADAGLIHDLSLNEFDETLVRRHWLVTKELKVTHTGHPDVDVGRLTYLRCSQFETKLEGHEVPSSFVPGCFHSLANDSRLGWHPDHIKKLGET